MGPTI